MKIGTAVVMAAILGMAGNVESAKYKAKRFGRPKPQLTKDELEKLSELSGKENKRAKKAYVKELFAKYYVD